MTVRPMKPSEFRFLRGLLYEAVFIPAGETPPPKEIVMLPELRLYWESFGIQRGDIAVTAEIDGSPMPTSMKKPLRWRWPYSPRSADRESARGFCFRFSVNCGATGFLVFRCPCRKKTRLTGFTAVSGFKWFRITVANV